MHSGVPTNIGTASASKLYPTQQCKDEVDDGSVKSRNYQDFEEHYRCGYVGDEDIPCHCSGVCT